MYVKTNWIDVPDPELATNEPKLNAQNLNHIEQGIFDSAEKNDLEVANRKIKALFDLTQGQAWDFDRDDNNAYEIAVPSGAKLATVQKYGGKSVVFNQRVKDPQFATGNTSWVTTSTRFSWNASDGVATVTCTQDTTANYQLAITQRKGQVSGLPECSGHKMFISADAKANKARTIRLWVRTDADTLIPGNAITKQVSANTFEKLEGIITCDLNTGKGYIHCDVSTNSVIGDTLSMKNAIFIDLTQMFGAGNEPTTVEEVRALLPNDYYEYNTGEIIYADVDKVVEQGRNIAKVADDTRTVRGLTIKITNGHLSVSGTNTGAVTERIISNTQNAETYKLINRILKDSPLYVKGATSLSNLSFKVDIFVNGSETWPSIGNGLVIPQGAVFSSMYVQDNTVGRTDTLEADIFICVGSTSAPYSPYHKIEHAISQAIRNLEGYGWSAGSVYNEVDFERKKYIQRLFKTVVDGINIQAQYYGVASSGHQLFFVELGAGGALSEGDLVSLLSNLYPTYPVSDTLNQPDRTIRYQAANRYRLYWQDDRYTSANAMNTALAQEPLEIISLLATPVETDISDILEPFNVEDGGTITFHNSNGDGYGIPVPSTEEYLVKLEEVG